MKNEKEKVDFLLEKNADEQLSKVNLEQLNNIITQKLNRTVKSDVSKKQYRILIKFAACIAIAASIAIFAILPKSDIKQKDMRPAAIVTFTRTHGSALVEILDSNEKENQNNEQSTFIIIRRQEPEITSNQISRDELDFACLL